MEDLDSQGKMTQFVVLTEGRTATSVQCARSFCKYPHPLAGSQVSLLSMHLVADLRTTPQSKKVLFLKHFILGLYRVKWFLLPQCLLLFLIHII